MAFVNTVLGPIHAEEMEITAVDECLFWGPEGWELDPKAWFKIDKAFEKGYNELMDFRLQGGRTYIDCGGIGAGRDLDIYVKLAAASAMNLVASTGLRMDDGIPPYFLDKDVDYFEKLFTRELTVGMGRTTIKAGLISVGHPEGGFGDFERSVYIAAARASRATGAAIVTHGIDNAMQHLELILGEGVDPGRIVISGCDEVIDTERDRRIAATGAVLSYCRIGVEEWSGMDYAMPDAARAAAVRDMLEAGLGDQILVSSGSAAWRLGCAEPSLNNVGHTYRYFLPKLRDAGAGDEAIRQITIGNPKRVLPIQ